MLTFMAPDAKTIGVAVAASAGLPIKKGVAVTIGPGRVADFTWPKLV